MPSISSISIIIKASTKPFVKGIQRAVKSTIKFTSSISDLTIKIAKYGAALITIAAGALALFLKKQFAIIDAVAKTGRALGITVGFLEGMKFAGSQLGVSNEKIIKSMKRFTRTLGEAKLGFGTGQTAFKAWGKSIKNFQSLNVEDSFVAVAKELRKIEDPTKQAAIAFQFFGRNGIEMLNIINENKDSIVNFLKESRRLKGAFDPLDVAQVEAANDAIDKLDSALDGIGKQLAFTLSPFIRVFGNVFTDILIRIREGFERNEQAIKSFIKNGILLIAPLVIQLKNNFTALGTVIAKLFSKIGPLALDVFRNKMLLFLIDVEFATLNMGKIWEIVLLDMEIGFKKLVNSLTENLNKIKKQIPGLEKTLNALRKIKDELARKQAEPMGEFEFGARMLALKAQIQLIKSSQADVLNAPMETKAGQRALADIESLRQQQRALEEQFAADQLKKVLNNNKRTNSADKKDKINTAKEVNKLNLKNLQFITKKKTKAEKEIAALQAKRDKKSKELEEGRKKLREGRLKEIDALKNKLSEALDKLLDFGKKRTEFEEITKPEEIKLPTLALKGSQEAAKILAESGEQQIQKKQLDEQKKIVRELKLIKSLTTIGTGPAPFDIVAPFAGL